MANRDGISYEWGVDAKMAGVDAGVKKLDAAVESTTKLHHATENLSSANHEHASTVKKNTDAWHKHKYEMEGIGQGLREAKGRMFEFGEAIGAVFAFEAIKEGIGLIKELGSEILKASAEEERTSKSFEMSFGVTGAKEALDYAEKFAKATEFTEDQTKGFLQPLLKAGVPLKEMDKYMAAAGDRAATFGNKLEGMNAAVSALRIMELSGHLSGRQARQLNIGVPQLKELPEFSKKTDKELQKILQAGSFTKEQVFRIIAGKDNVLGDASVQMGGLMGAKLDKLADLPHRLFQQFYKSPAFDDLKGKIDGILKAFDPDSANGKAIVKAFGDIGMSLVHMFDGVKIEDVVKGVMSAFKLIPPVIEGAKNAIGWVIDNFDVIKDTFSALTAPIGWVIAGFGAFTEVIADVIVWGIQLYDTITDLASSFSDTLTGAITTVLNIGSMIYDKAFELAGNIWQGLKDGIMGGISFVKDAISNLGDSMIGGLKNVLGIHSPSSVFENLGEMTGEGFTIGVNNKSSKVDDVMRGAFAIPAPNGGRTLGDSGGGMGGGISITIPVTVQAHAGQNPDELGRAIGEQVRAVVLPMLIDALEQAGAEAAA